MACQKAIIYTYHYCNLETLFAFICGVRWLRSVRDFSVNLTYTFTLKKKEQSLCLYDKFCLPLVNVPLSFKINHHC